MGTTTHATAPERWAARPFWAAFIRVVAFVTPIAASIAFVNVASRVVPVPTGSVLFFIGWWILLSGGATAVMVAVDALSRRLLPIAALFKLSLVFPDRAPSRFELALKTGTVEDLEQRLAGRTDDASGSTPDEAAMELLRLVASLDRHDRLTRGHCERVRAYAQTIALELKLSDEDRDLLNWAALLHDVGKVGIPTEILTKEGRPTDEEWDLLKQHPRIGEELIAPLREWLGEWSAAVSDHHERWDGFGYPAGKAGESIAFAGRIVAVADVFDVITSARSYKAAFSTAQARSELAKNAGSQFDPRVVRAFLNVGLGRLRLIMGPLSWLAHAPVLARLPLTPAVSALTGTVAAVAAATTTGLVQAPTPPPAKTHLVAYTAHPAARPSGAEQDHTRRRQPAEQPPMQPEQPAGAPVQRRGARGSVVPAAPMVRWTTDEDTAGVVDLGLSDAPDVSRVRVIELPQFGTAGVTAAAAIAYKPPRDFSGTTTLGYEACWLRRGCAPGAVAITVRPVDDAPVAEADLIQTLEDEPASIDALANDTDVDSSDPFLVAAWGETDGKASIANGRIGWRPPRDFAGRATFLYAIADAEGATGVGRVTVDVVPVNDAPLAAADHASTDEDTPVQVDVLGNDSDADGDDLRLTEVGVPSAGSVTHHTGTLTYAPPRDFDGSALVTYTVGDGHGGSASSTARIDVQAVNDAPRTADDAAEVWTGSTATIEPLANDSDADDDPLTLVAAGPASLGTVMIEGARVRYTPPFAPGEDSFPYVVRDGKGGQAIGTVRVSVRGINSPPSFVAGRDQTVLEDAGPQAAAWASSISAGRPDEAGQHVSFAVGATNHTLFAPGGEPALSPDGVLTYTPATNAHGTSTLTITAHDDGGTEHGGADESAPQTRTITIQPVNDAPSAVVGPSRTVSEDAGPQTFAAWAAGISPGPPDESGQAVSFIVTTTNAGLFTGGGQPAVSPAGTLTFTPAPNANGIAAVTVRAHDDGGTAGGGADTGAPQSFTIAVTPENDGPDAGADSLSVNEDAAGVTFDVLANDSDADADPLSVTSTNLSGITDGTLTQGAGGQFTYVPNAAFNGAQSFSYTVSDGHGGNDSAAVTITVVAQPDAPVAADDAYVTTAGSPVVRVAPGLLANDGDEDGDSLTARTTPDAEPANGTVAIAADGSFTYTPDVAFTGTDTFTYRIDDGTGLSDDGVVTVTVGASSTTTLYLDSTGPSADVWNLIAGLPAAVSPVPDFDGDGEPGLTIRASNGSESVTDAARWQAWTSSVTGSALVLNGPVVLGLWSTVANFNPSESVHPHVFVYDCVAGGASCTKLAGTHLQVSNWNGGVADWVYRELTVGSVSATIPVGHELRVRIQVSQRDLWVAMTAAYPSRLWVTGT